VNVAVHGLALAALLCPLSLRAEEGAARALQSPEVEGRIESLVPEPVKQEARSAMERAGKAIGDADGPFSLGAFDRHAPVVINADELEASEENGRRLIVFRRNVQVSQGSLKLRASRLSAVYPKDAKQPSRLEASGGVVIREGDREARCERVVYDRPGRKLDCLGSASLRDGEDRVAGQSIAFDLARRSVRVGGGSELWFQPPPAEESAGTKTTTLPMPWLESESPARVRAARLEASDGPEGRRIRFDGDVEVEQKGGVLRAQRLEAVYPPGGDQPDKLIATGEVSLTEGSREARCDSAEYLRLENRVRCLGGVASANGDRLEGDLIDFTLGEETLAVRGRTRLVLAPRDQERATP
jgi:lipopolysaccharide export system protein LptA